MRSQLYIIFLGVLIAGKSHSQDVLMQGWYWDYPKTALGQNWTDTLDSKLENLATKGITHIWLPPFSRASFGNNSNGYDPKDLYDLGGYGLGPTGFGTRAQVDSLITHINTFGMTAVADVVYNHRDGGKAENNLAVEGWIENYNCTKRNNGDNPYPSDRFRCVIPLGGSSPNGTGTYYFKIASASKHPDFYNKQFKFYVQTNKIGYQNLTPLTENEPNGGADCGQPFNTITLGRDMNVWLDTYGSSCTNGSCGVEEIALTINANDYFSSGDTLFINMSNVGDYSDHFIYGIWSSSRSMNIVNDIVYQTYTDFTNLPSGRGSMNYTNFKPNGNPTNLNGDWDSMLFFYDYDQAVSDTRQELIDWTKWLNDSIGIDGIRMDAVKHFNPAFVADLLDSMHLNNQTPNFIVGEFYDFNPTALKTWVENVENNMLPSAAAEAKVQVFDFALRGTLEAACDQNNYDTRNIFNSGIVYGANGNKDQSVTFVNNHDFRDGNQMVDVHPELAYAYILSNPFIGSPSIFYPDYYGVNLPAGPDANVGGDINLLLNIKSDYIDGASALDKINRFDTPYSINYISGLNSRTLAYYIDNGGTDANDALVVINFHNDTLIAEMPLGNLHTQAFEIFREKTGKSFTPFVLSDADNKLKIALPPYSFGIWVNADVDVDCGNDDIIYVDRNASGANNGSDWQNAYIDLSSALYIANSCENVEQVWIKEGQYTSSFFGDRNESFQLARGYTIYGGFPSIGNPSLEDRNPTDFETILSGSIGTSSVEDNSYNVILAYASDIDTARLDGIVIANGNANEDALNDDNTTYGAGIFNLANLILNNCQIRSCSSTNDGICIYNNNSAYLKLSNSQLIDNEGAQARMKCASGGIIETNGFVEIE